jgi:hypothetical protein
VRNPPLVNVLPSFVFGTGALSGKAKVLAQL